MPAVLPAVLSVNVLILVRYKINNSDNSLMFCQFDSVVHYVSEF